MCARSSHRSNVHVGDNVRPHTHGYIDIVMYVFVAVRCRVGQDNRTLVRLAIEGQWYVR
jgi:hypothetical protein